MKDKLQKSRIQFQVFNRKDLKLKPLSQRNHGLNISSIRSPGDEAVSKTDEYPSILLVAQNIINARKNSAAIIMMIGAHVIRSGVQKYLIDLMERGYISCLSMNGACAIHDYELALDGATTESVARYVKSAQFGL